MAAFFENILDRQQAAAEAAGRERLRETPTARDVLAWDIRGLSDADSGQPADRVGTFLPQLSADGAQLAFVHSLSDPASAPASKSELRDLIPQSLHLGVLHTPWPGATLS